MGNNEGNTGSLRGVPKMTALHVYRLDPSTSTEHLLNFLSPQYPEVTCEKLQSRHPELYSSFKVNIYEEHAEAALNPDNWPKNACIRNFLYLAPREKQI